MGEPCGSVSRAWGWRMKANRKKGARARPPHKTKTVEQTGMIAKPRWRILCHLSSSPELEPVLVGFAQNMREADKLARKYLRDLPLLVGLSRRTELHVKRVTEYLEIMARRLNRPVARAEWILDPAFLPDVMKDLFRGHGEFPRVRIEPYQTDGSVPLT